MKRSTILIIAINVYGLTAATLTFLGNLRTPIIIVPFILNTFIIDPFRNRRPIPDTDTYRSRSQPS